MSRGYGRHYEPPMGPLLLVILVILLFYWITGCWTQPEVCILWKYNPDGSRTCVETRLNPDYPGNQQHEEIK